MTPDVIYDQMVGAGVAKKLIFSWLGNPGVGSLHAVRRRIEDQDPAPLEIEEYSHFGMVCRYVAGASNLPFFPIRSYYESDIPKVNPKIVPMTSPYDDATEVYAVPPLSPTSRSCTRSAPTATATPRSGGCSGVRRRRRSRRIV